VSLTAEFWKGVRLLGHLRDTLQHYDAIRAHGSTHADARDVAVLYLRRKAEGLHDAESATHAVNQALETRETA
jgi:hypothetical protein